MAIAPSRWMRRLPAHGLSGIAVALGIGAVHLLFSVLAGGLAAQLATSGAVLASLADLPNPVHRVWRRVSAAALLGCASALAVMLLRPLPLALGAGIAAIAFVATMTLAWGPRAGPVSFAPILALLFTMALPVSAPGSAATLAGWNLLGALAYLAWSLAANALLQRRYRSLALASALQAAAQLLRSRAALLEERERGHGGTGRLRAWIGDEARLAERLQSARDLVFAAPDTPRARRETALLLHAIELRDRLLASRLDLELLGADATARLLRERLASGLRQLALALDAAEDALRAGSPALPADDALLAVDPLLAAARLPQDDPRTRLLPALEERLQHLAESVAAVHALLRGEEPQLALSWPELQLFVAPEGWPPRALLAHLSPGSPVLRHAVRAALALGAAYFIALLLPWTAHPHWLVISVAVVLRGSLEQTLSRRDARVLGTALGCLFVLWLAHVPSPLLLNLVFLASVGIAHGYVTVRYLVTSAAVTVMALLQTHLLDPGAGFPIGERLADTLLGALLAWGFSYVLPSWERRTLPQATGQALQALQDYARQVLLPGPDGAVAQRLARRRAYDALGALAAAVERSAVEPRRVRPPVRELSLLLDHAQSLMAHLSAIRLLLLRHRVDVAQPQAAQALHEGARALQAALALPAFSGDTAAPAAGPDSAVPERPPVQDALPWLQRRLEIALQDGLRARLAACDALARLGAEAGTTPARGAS